MRAPRGARHGSVVRTRDGCGYAVVRGRIFGVGLGHMYELEARGFRVDEANERRRRALGRRSTQGGGEPIPFGPAAR